MSFKEVLVFPLEQDIGPRTRRRLMISGGLRNAITLIRTSTASISILEARRIVKKTFNLGLVNLAYVSSKERDCEDALFVRVSHPDRSLATGV